jgi:type I restriction enzyme, S subunit
MNSAQLLAHFDRISEAAEAIPRLRNFILDLAVRGKLIEQDARDEPASELLKRIQAERANVNDGTVSKNRAGSQVDIGQIPFELPELWAWSTLGQVSRYGLPEKVDSNKKISANTWVLDLEDIAKDNSRLIERVLSSSRPFQSSKTRFKRGDVLFGKLRPYLNKVLVADADGVCTTEIVPIRGFCGIAPGYIRLVLKSSLTMKRINRLMYGMKMPRLGTDDALSLSFPLPPLAEQHRIILKVDELMALCDRLEAAQAERESRKDQLVVASLQRLNKSTDKRDGEVFREHARLYFNHLPRLTTRPEHIQQLRQTILNLAVRGQLVPQDPNDEPATTLLNRLVENAKSYALDQGIAPLQPEPIGEEIACTAPSGWAWVRLCSLFKVITDGDHQPPPKSEGGIAFLTIGNITMGQLNFSNCRFVAKKYWESLASYRKPVFGDILYTVVGATYGRPAYVNSRRDFCVQRHIAILKPTDQMNVRFLCSLLASPLVYEQATRSTTGTAQPTIPLRPLRNFLVLLPPLAEQYRIVAIVDELMALCDRLETQLTITRTESRRLLEAVLHEALGGKEELSRAS